MARPDLIKAINDQYARNARMSGAKGGPDNDYAIAYKANEVFWKLRDKPEKQIEFVKKFGNITPNHNYDDMSPLKRKFAERQTKKDEYNKIIFEAVKKRFEIDGMGYSAVDRGVVPYEESLRVANTWGLGKALYDNLYAYVHEQNKNLTELREQTLSQLNDKALSTLSEVYVEHASFSQDVTEIPDSLFKRWPHDTKSVQTVELHDGIKRIGDSAFEYCESLKELNIPDSVEYIGVDALKGCTGLESITIPKGLDISQCGLPEGVTVIEREPLIDISEPTGLKDRMNNMTPDTPSDPSDRSGKTNRDDVSL